MIGAPYRHGLLVAFLLTICGSSVSTNGQAVTQTRATPSALWHEYLAYRRSRGLPQPVWLDALRRPLSCPTGARVHGDRVVSPLAAYLLRAGCLDLRSPEQLRALVARNRKLIDELHGIPEPQGALPIHAAGGFDDFDIPLVPLAKTKAYLLLAHAVCADDAQDALLSLQAYDRIVRLLVAGGTLLEMMAANALEVRKWELLLLASDRSPQRLAGYIARSKPIITPRTWAKMLLQFHRRRVLAAVQQSPNLFLVHDTANDAQLEQLDRLYHDLASLVAGSADFPELLRLFDRAPQGAVRQVLREDLLVTWNGGRVLLYPLYLSDLRAFVSAVNRGLDEVPAGPGKLWVLEVAKRGDGVLVIARRGQRNVRLWPPCVETMEKGVFSQLVPAPAGPTTEQVLRDYLERHGREYLPKNKP